MDPRDADKMEDLLRGLGGEPPQLDTAFLDAPQDPPVAEVVRPQWGRRLAGGGAFLAAAAALLAVVVGPGGDGVRHRGDNDGVPVSVELRLMLKADEGYQRLGRQDAVQVGAQVFFRVSTDRPGEVALWAEQSGERTELGRLDAGPEAVEVTGPQGGALGWAFDAPGTVTFFASSAEDGSCPEETCDRWPVTVQ